MTDQKQNTQTPTEPVIRQEASQQRREERREGKSGGAWILGVVLILLGALFLFQNIGRFNLPFYNWWALFILIPALGSLGNAYRGYRYSGKITGSVRNSLFGGIILLIVTATLLFNLSWTYLGPALIILVGLGLLLGGTVLKD